MAQNPLALPTDGAYNDTRPPAFFVPDALLHQPPSLFLPQDHLASVAPQHAFLPLGRASREEYFYATNR
jgi:hypothetical protein